jgi:hypothetical protein
MATISMTGVSNKTEDYRGFTISWQEPPITSAQWTANVASESPQLYALMARNGAQVIDGHDRDDMLATSKMYIDSLLNRPSA